MVLAMADAKPVTKEEAPQFFNVAEEMSIAAGVPMPRLMVMETDALNAFATGTSTHNAAIVATRGLLATLNRDELQGVIGHEMGHIANLDTRYMTIVGVTVGTDRAGRRHDPAHAAMGQLQPQAATATSKATAAAAS